MSDDQSTVRSRLSRRPVLVLSALAFVAAGGGAGALAVAASRPSATMAPATPVAIRSLASDSGDIVTVRGRVAEIFGNHVVVADATGRALVDLGREGEDAALVAAGETVTAQGRFEHGAIHAAFLVKADGKVTALGPLGHPHDRPGDHGPDDRGPAGHGPADCAPAPSTAAPAPVPPAPSAAAPAPVPPAK